MKSKTKVVWDRTREVNYSDSLLFMNSYSCSSCNTHYKFEQINHNFCPFCGVKYKHQVDVSA